MPLTSGVPPPGTLPRTFWIIPTKIRSLVGSIQNQVPNAPPHQKLSTPCGSPLSPGRSYLLKTSTLTTAATATDLRYRMNVETLRAEPATSLLLNEIGRVRFEAVRPLAVDAYAQNRRTGAFILIDRRTNSTAGAGMILAFSCPPVY